MLVEEFNLSYSDKKTVHVDPKYGSLASIRQEPSRVYSVELSNPRIRAWRELYVEGWKLARPEIAFESLEG